MPKIVNLSAIHTVKSFDISMNAFALLCDKYSRNCCGKSCPTFFSKMSNKAWVAYKYYFEFKPAIESYKLGNLSTKDFLKKLLNLFHFLDDDNLVLRNRDIKRLDKAKKQFVSLKDVEQVTVKDYVLALLEEAWNEIIALEQSDWKKLSLLTTSTEPLYFISNTNELNVNKIIHLLKEQYPETKFYTDVDISVAKDEQPLKIADTIFLCLSYRFNAFKVGSENNSAVSSTPSLLKTLLEKSFKNNLDQVEVISQYQKDLDQAIQSGVSRDKVIRAADFFQNHFSPQPI